MRASSACTYSCAVCSALQYAAAAGYGECMPLLLECGANINAQDQNGVTALSAGTRHGHPGIVKFLINNGADIYIRDIRQTFLRGNAIDSDATWCTCANNHTLGDLGLEFVACSILCLVSVIVAVYQGVNHSRTAPEFPGYVQQQPCPCNSAYLGAIRSVSMSSQQITACMVHSSKLC